MPHFIESGNRWAPGSGLAIVGTRVRVPAGVLAGVSTAGRSLRRCRRARPHLHAHLPVLGVRCGRCREAQPGRRAHPTGVMFRIGRLLAESRQHSLRWQGAGQRGTANDSRDYAGRCARRPLRRNGAVLDWPQSTRSESVLGSSARFVVRSRAWCSFVRQAAGPHGRVTASGVTVRVWPSGLGTTNEAPGTRHQELAAF